MIESLDQWSMPGVLLQPLVTALLGYAIVVVGNAYDLRRRGTGEVRWGDVLRMSDPFALAGWDHETLSRADGYAFSRVVWSRVFFAVWMLVANLKLLVGAVSALYLGHTLLLLSESSL